MTPKKRILILLEATLGGTRKHVVDLLEGLDTDAFDITFGYATQRGDRNFFVDLERIQSQGKVKCLFIPMYREISPLKDLIAFLQLCWIIKKGKYDLVHAHSSKAGLLGRLATKLISPFTPTLYTPNSMAFHIHPLYKNIEKGAQILTTAVIAVSPSEQEEILSHRILPEKKVVMIKSGVHCSPPVHPTKLRKELGIAEDVPIVLSIGRLTRQKDPFTFFRAAPQVLFAHPNTHFVWIGHGELESEVRAYIQRMGISASCSILGWRTDVSELLSGADVFVLPSLYESFGYVTCEAMACGLPVVATRVSGTKDIVVEGETGFLVPPGDAEKFSERITELLSHKDKRLLFGQRGKEQVQKNFSVTQMVLETERVYRLLTQKKRKFSPASFSFNRVESNH